MNCKLPKCFPVSMNFEPSNVYESFESQPQSGVILSYDIKTEYKTGDQVNFNGSIYKYVQTGSSSGIAPVDPRNKMRTIWVRIGDGTPSPYDNKAQYITGDRVIFNGSVYSFIGAGASGWSPADDEKIVDKENVTGNKIEDLTGNDKQKLAGEKENVTGDKKKMWVLLGETSSFFSSPSSSSLPSVPPSSPSPSKPSLVIGAGTSYKDVKAANDIIPGLDNYILFILIGITVIILIVMAAFAASK